EQQIAPNTVASVSYVCSRGRHLQVLIDRNLTPPTSTLTYAVSDGPLAGPNITVPFFTGPRPNPRFNQMLEIRSDVNARYDALIVSLNRRLTNGFQIQAGYTWSKATDNGQNSPGMATPMMTVLNPFDLGLEQGTSSVDYPQRFGVNAVW